MTCFVYLYPEGNNHGTQHNSRHTLEKDESRILLLVIDSWLILIMAEGVRVGLKVGM